MSSMPSSEPEFSSSPVSTEVTRSGDFEDVPVGVAVSRYQCQIPISYDDPPCRGVPLSLLLEASSHVAVARMNNQTTPDV